MKNEQKYIWIKTQHVWQMLLLLSWYPQLQLLLRINDFTSQMQWLENICKAVICKEMTSQTYLIPLIALISYKFTRVKTLYCHGCIVIIVKYLAPLVVKYLHQPQIYRESPCWNIITNMMFRQQLNWFQNHSLLGYFSGVEEPPPPISSKKYAQK